MNFIKAPMNYIGNKYRIMGTLQRLFPSNINLMVDLFCGGCDVTFNSKAKKRVANDINYFVVNIYKEIQQLGVRESIKKIEGIIAKWGLTQKNKIAYEVFRNHCNTNGSPLEFYTLMCFSFNYQFRFNASHHYNNPFGKDRSSFNDTMKRNLLALENIVGCIEYTAEDFRNFDYTMLNKGDFLYADPPYLISCGSYNDGKRGFKGWTYKDEIDLYDILNNLAKSGINFALSNITHHKGEINTILLEWVKKNNYNVYPININYNNCNYQTRKSKKPTREVLITNYSPQYPELNICQAELLDGYKKPMLSLI